ncbi:MAG: ABC transporter permease [Patescibacteria group bacterium]
MNFSQCVHNSFIIIGRNKLRSFLTMLGIIIGIMSVIVIMSVGAGAQSLILNQIKSMGSNLIGILPGKSEENGPPASVFGTPIVTLKNKDIQNLVSPAFPRVIAASSYARGLDTVAWGDNKVDTYFVGVSASYIDVEDTFVSQGRFFTEEEEKSIARVAVLGSKTAEDLFGDENPLGHQIKIKKTNFSIIGVMRERGVSGFQNQDDQIFVPVTAAQKLLLGINYINFARVKIDSSDSADDSVEYIKQSLRASHNIDNPEDDDFSVRSADQGLEVMGKITNAIRLFLVAIAAIALVVGGIGIMNIMLAAVQERTQEIGLRKAIGAKSKQIISQFLFETITITFLGGVIGIILGVAISATVAMAAQSMGYQWDLVISLPSIFLACLVSIGVGFIFGIAPARRAAGLDPIEALRYE